VWVLTGDKLETAISIGVACRLLGPTMRALVLRNADFESLQASSINADALHHASLGYLCTSLVRPAEAQGYDAGQRLRRHLTDVLAMQQEPECRCPKPLG
jgi:magnesium-transporting ATPase (P-type)